MENEVKVVLMKIKELSLELIKAIDVATQEEKEEKAIESKKEVTLVEVRSVLAGLSRDGFTSEVRELLKKYGSSKLSDVKENDYEALLNDAKELKQKEGK